MTAQNKEKEKSLLLRRTARLSAKLPHRVPHARRGGSAAPDGGGPKAGGGGGEPRVPPSAHAPGKTKGRLARPRPSHVTRTQARPLPRPPLPAASAKAVRFSRLNLAAIRPLPQSTAPGRGPESNGQEDSGCKGAARRTPSPRVRPAVSPLFPPRAAAGPRRGDPPPSARRCDAGHSPAGAPWLPSAAAPSVGPWWGPPASPRPGRCRLVSRARPAPAPADAAAAV